MRRRLVSSDMKETYITGAFIHAKYGIIKINPVGDRFHNSWPLWPLLKETVILHSAIAHFKKY